MKLKLFRNIFILLFFIFSTTGFTQELQTVRSKKTSKTKKSKRSKFEKTSKVRLHIDQPISADYPDMEIYVSVIDKKNSPILSLIRDDFKVMVDGEEVNSKIDVQGFQYTEEGIDYSLLLSGNGMMEGEPIDQQLNAAVVLLEELRKQDTLSIYVFGEEIQTVFEFQKKDESLLDKISKIKILGGNPHLYDALVYTTRRFDKSDNKRKVLIVMSDGRENGSRYKKEQLYSVVDEKNIPVYSIGMKLMAGQNLHRVHDLSKHTGGDYLYSDNIQGVSKLMKKITTEVKMGYLITCTVDSLPADDKIHQLQVKANYEGTEASFFKNFRATKVPLSFWVKVVLIILTVVGLILLIIFMIVHQKRMRKRMGITTRKCPVCNKRMKDEWDECLFCKYLPAKKKKKSKIGQEQENYG